MKIEAHLYTACGCKKVMFLDRLLPEIRVPLLCPHDAFAAPDDGAPLPVMERRFLLEGGKGYHYGPNEYVAHYAEDLR